MTIQHWYDFTLLFDVSAGNPNGDPDADNEPRRELGTDRGVVTDVCVKRKIRNFVDLAREYDELTDDRRAQLGILVTEGAVLNDAHDAALEKSGATAPTKGKAKATRDQIADARKDMCERYFDVRTFGAVLARDGANDKVTGPVQLGFARSIDPIITQRHAITRCAATREEVGKENKTMGGKWTTPYALYQVHGTVSAPQAKKTGFSDDDLKLLFRSLVDMWRHDRSAARGDMSPVALVVYKHSHALGNCAPDVLHDALSVESIGDGMSRDSYRIKLDESSIPAGVTVERKLWPREPKMSSQMPVGSHGLETPAA